jgi:putative peptidoglycan lipid II flippase
MSKKKLLKSTAIVGGFTLISRILGFIRDVVIAHTFGASVSTDAFLVAFKIPNFMRRLFAEGAFSQAFTPVLSEYKTLRDTNAVKLLVSYVAGNLGSVLLILTLLGIVIAPVFVFIFAPGFIQHQEKYQLTVAMLRITFPYLLFIALTAFAGAILNTYGRFAVPALTPVLLNICLITAALWFTSLFQQPIMALAWAVLIAGILQLAFQVPFLSQLHLLPKPRINWHDEGVQRINQLMIPALFGVSVSQINLLIDTLMASFLVTGSVSWLYYSDRLMEFPVGVFGLALATVTLPQLSKSVAQNDMHNYNNTLDWALRWVFLVGIPAMLGLIVLAQPMLTTLFYNGNAFDAGDVAMTARSLIAYSIGLLGFVLIKVLASGFYSHQNTRTPVKIAVIAMTANIIFNLTLIGFLQHAGLALATSLAALLNASLLYRELRKQNFFHPLPGWQLLLFRIGMAGLLMAILLWWGSNLLQWFEITRLEQVFYLFGGIIVGMLVYVISLFTFGFRLHQISN